MKGFMPGMPYVDFLDWQEPDGDCEGSAGMLFFDASGIWRPTDVREIHMVYMMCDGSNATPVGGDSYPNASHPEWMVPRGNSRECYWTTCCAAASPKMADGSAWYTANTFLADGTTAATSFHVLTIAATGDLAPQTFAMDRNCAIGGVKLCEVLFYTGATNDTATATAINRALLKKWTGLGSGADFGKRLSVALANGGTLKLGAGASMVTITSVSGNGTLDAGDIAGVGTLSATVAADGTVEPVTVKGAVAFADEVTLNVNVASECKPADGEYVVFAADALTNVDLSKWTFNVTGNWLDDRVYGFKVVDGKVCLTVQKKGFVIIFK